VELWKDVLIPGTYRLADGRRVAYTPADCRAAAHLSNRMLLAGLRIPWCWEHDARAGPAYWPRGRPLADLCPTVFGEATRFRVSADGVLWARAVIDGPADARRFLAVGSVSPRVQWGWRDSRGRVWPGVLIYHVAATTRPIQTGQGAPVLVGVTGAAAEWGRT
jgi:hypothetical protein